MIVPLWGELRWHVEVTDSPQVRKWQQFRLSEIKLDFNFGISEIDGPASGGVDKSKDNKMELSNWAPEHSGALREFVAKGMSYSEAAQEINSRFNTSYSRSAALGRARRLGLTADQRRKPSIPATPADLRGNAVPRASDFKAPALSRPTAPVFKEIKPVKLRCVAIEPRHLSLIELERSDCRYPYGGDEEGEAITFCGHPRRPGSSYCAPHFYLCRDPVVPVVRTADTVSLSMVEVA